MKVVSVPDVEEAPVMMRTVLGAVADADTLKVPVMTITALVTAYGGVLKVPVIMMETA